MGHRSEDAINNKQRNKWVGGVVTYVIRPSMQEVGGSIPISANPREVR